MRIAVDPDFLTVSDVPESPDGTVHLHSPSALSAAGRTISSPASHQVSAGHNLNNNIVVVNDNNNMNNNSADIQSSPATAAGDGYEVKVITTIPPENSYPKSLYPYTPFRLLPMSRFADVGKFYEWQELKQKVMRHNNVACDREVTFTGKLTNGFNGTEYSIRNDTDFRTALKVAELSDDSLDIIMEKKAQRVSQTGCADISFEELRFQQFVQETLPSAPPALIPRTSRPSGSVTAPVPAPAPDHAGCLSEEAVAEMITRKWNEQKEELQKQMTESITQKVLEKVANVMSAAAQPETRRTETADTSTGTSEVSGSGETGELHGGIVCDNCDGELRGVRYKCSVCVDFDLCAKCEALENVHMENHFMLKIKTPQTRNPDPAHVHSSVLSALQSRVLLAPGDRAIAVSIPSSDIANPNWSAIMQRFQSESRKVMVELSGQHLDLSGSSCQHAERSVRPKIKKRSFAEVPSGDVGAEPPKRPGPETSDAGSEDDSVLRTAAEPLCRSAAPRIMFMSATLVADETIANGTHLPPGSRFKKVWRVRNTGTKSWNSRTSLKYCWGNELFEAEGKVKEVAVPRLRPWEEGRISLNFVAPNGHFHGSYASHWRLHHRGQPFGQRLICQIVVDPRSPAPEKPVPEFRPRKVKNREAKLLRKEKTHKDLTEAAVKMIRFQETAVKMRLASRTTTPLNTPFDGPSPPKSPEPVAQPVVNLNSADSPPEMRAAVTRDFGFSPDESVCKSMEEKEIQVTCNELRSEAGMEGWSSPESSDEFVVVQLPKCFDLNTPFDVQEFNKLADQLERASLSDDEKAFEELSEARDAVDSEDRNDVLVDVSDFSLSDSSDFENVDRVPGTPSLSGQPVSLSTTPLTPERVESSPLCAEASVTEFTYAPIPVDGSSTEPSGAPSVVSADRSLQSEADVVNPDVPPVVQPAAEPLIHPTNPFLNRRGENVIHVLPESIVNGAVNAATQVVQNVSRVLFSPHERSVPNNGLRGGTRNETSLIQAMSQLFEMGFWNENLNQELLQLNHMDLSDTVSALLQSTDRNDNAVVRTQPQVNTQVKDPFIEFD